MSVPARKLENPPPVPSRVRPSHTPAARPLRATPSRPRRRARRGSPFAFWILVAVVAGVLIIGIASLSAMLVQASFQGDDLRTQLGTLQQQHEVLREQVAAASSPQRIMEWARERGMQMPQSVRTLHLPASDGEPA